MSKQTNSSGQNTLRIPRDRVFLGVGLAVIGFIIFIFGAKPEWFALDRSPVVGFVQITVFLVGLAVMCLGGYFGLASLWGGEERTIAADIGLRLISTGYVICVFSGMADIFGLSMAGSPDMPFFGLWQAAGVQIGMSIIALGMVLLIPFRHSPSAS